MHFRQPCCTRNIAVVVSSFFGHRTDCDSSLWDFIPPKGFWLNAFCLLSARSISRHEIVHANIFKGTRHTTTHAKNVFILTAERRRRRVHLAVRRAAPLCGVGGRAGDGQPAAHGALLGPGQLQKVPVARIRRLRPLRPVRRCRISQFVDHRNDGGISHLGGPGVQYHCHVHRRNLECCQIAFLCILPDARSRISFARWQREEWWCSGRWWWGRSGGKNGKRPAATVARRYEQHRKQRAADATHTFGEQQQQQRVSSTKRWFAPSFIATHCCLPQQRADRG